MSQTLKWYQYSDSDAVSFNVYRSIMGFKVPFPNSLEVGDVLIFSATSRDIQRVTISSTSIAAVAENINNQASGLKATVGTNGTDLYIRTTSKEPKLKLYPCTFLTNVGIAPAVFFPQTNYVLLTNITAYPAQNLYTYTDPDGDPLDFYYVTSLTATVESIPTIALQGVVAPADLCVIEGRVIDFQNNPVPSAVIKASTIAPVNHSGNSADAVTPKGEIRFLTDLLGRWSMVVQQNQLLLLNIEAIGYNEVIQVPLAPFILFNQLVPVKDYLFSISGDPNP
jgi:hypothetical protein